MAKISYNGVEFGNILTHSVQVEPVRDPSGTDYQYTRYVVRVQSMLSTTLNEYPDAPPPPAPLSPPPPPPVEPFVKRAVPPMALARDDDGDLVIPRRAETFADGFARIEEKLRTPRRPFKYVVDDGDSETPPEPLIEVPGTADALVTDLANGPLPEVIAFKRVSPGVIFIDWAVAVCLRAVCPDAVPTPGTTVGGPGDPVWVSHRWEETTDILANWLTRKTRTGTVILPTGVDPELLRAAVTPTVPPGFRRESARYAVSRDGLQVDYTFVDQELMRVPPVPLIKLYGSQESGSPNYGAGFRSGSISLVGVGAKTTPPADILAVLVVIAMKRATAAGVVVSARGTYLTKARVREVFDDDKNEVHLSMEFKTAPDKGRTTAAAQVQRAVNNARSGFLSGMSFGPAGALVGALVGVATDGGRTAAETGPWLNGANPPNPAPAPQPNEQGRDRAALPLSLEWLGQPLAGANPGRGIAPPTRGTAEAVKLAAAVLNDPCGKTAVLKTAETSNRLVGTAEGGASVEAFTPPYPDDYDALYDAGGSPGVYDQFQCSSHYTDDPGFRVLPSTKPGEAAQKVRTMNPVRRLVCEWYVKRTGGPPVLPDVQAAAQAGTENWVFTKGTTTLNEMNVAGDGATPVYEAAGLFEFTALDYAQTLLAAPVPPFLGAVATSTLNNNPMIGLAAEAAALPRGKNILFPVETTGPAVPPPPPASPPPP